MFPGLSLSAGARLLVVVAHPDDETFGCGSLLLRAASEGLVTTVCCATRGEAGEPSPGVQVPGGDLGALRERELHAAAAILRVAEVELLGFADSGMAGEPAHNALAAATPEHLDETIGAVIGSHSPDVLLTLDASDGHRDHVAVRDSVTRWGRLHHVPVFLQCLPRSLMGAWAAHLAQQDPASAYLALGELGTPDEDLDAVLDQSAHLADREHAIQAHRSQVSPFEGLPDALYEAFLARDHLRRVV